MLYDLLKNWTQHVFWACIWQPLFMKFISMNLLFGIFVKFIALQKSIQQYPNVTIVATTVCLQKHSLFLILLLIAPQCPRGMIYQQCGPRCPQTCDNVGSDDCYSGCAEGCFCPEGQVLSGGRCINPIACPGNN